MAPIDIPAGFSLARSRHQGLDENVTHVPPVVLAMRVKNQRQVGLVGLRRKVAPDGERVGFARAFVADGVQVVNHAVGARGSLVPVADGRVAHGDVGFDLVALVDGGIFDLALEVLAAGLHARDETDAGAEEGIIVRFAVGSCGASVEGCVGKEGFWRRKICQRVASRGNGQRWACGHEGGEEAKNIKAVHCCGLGKLEFAIRKIG